MAEIIGNIEIMHVFKKENSFYVADSFSYRDENYHISVFSGWITDGASIPRLFWNIFPPISGRYLEAAILHDALYRSQILKRAECDKIFLKAMKASSVAGWKRYIIYYTVRLFGWIAWRNNKTNSNKFKKFVKITPRRQK